MSSFKDRSSSLFSPLQRQRFEQSVLPSQELPADEYQVEGPRATTGLSGSGQGQSLGGDRQIPFSQVPSSLAGMRQLALQPSTDAGYRRTDALSESSGGLPPRASVVIKADMKRVPPPAVPLHVHKKRRLVVSLTAVALLVLVTAVTLFTFSPGARDTGTKAGINPAAWGSGNMVNNPNSHPGQLVAQATATAVFYQQNDGYDPNSNGGYTVSDGSGSLDWPYGQCTYWSNLRYHQLTGTWVSWSGDADQWVAGARAAGWNVSTSPHIPSIMVMMPYIEGASSFGHVAVAEGYNDNVVHTSNMNWYANGGGWGIVSDEDFTLQDGIYFIWK